MSKKLKFSHQAFVRHLIYLMKVIKNYNNLSILTHFNSFLKNATLTFFYGSHSVLDSPDLWANDVVYLTVEFPVVTSDYIRIVSFKVLISINQRSKFTPLYMYKAICSSVLLSYYAWGHIRLFDVSDSLWF